MTLTSPTCPIAGQMVTRAETAIAAVEDVEEASVELVWDPPCSPEMTSDEGKLKLRSIGISVPESNADAADDTHPARESPF